MKYKGLIVDYGGVLTTPIFNSFDAFCNSNKIDPTVLRKYLREGLADTTGNHPIHLLEVGVMHVNEWNKILAEAISSGLSAPIDADTLTERLFSGVKSESSLISAVQDFRAAGTKTALCSNSWGPDGYPREMFEETFDAVVISGEVGMRKPNGDIYLFTAGKLGLETAECVFVDDFPVNVAGAEKVGMTGLLHKSSEETIGALGELFT